MEAYYPIFLKVKGKTCVVIGGGKVAERRVKGLLKYGASIRVVSPTLSPILQGMAQDKLIEWTARPYNRGDLEKAFIVIASSNDPEINRAVYEEAESRGLLVNVVDRPALCRFIVPAIIENNGMSVALSSSGQSPAVTKKFRIELEKGLMPRYSRLLKLVAQVRKNYVGRNLKPQAWEEALDSHLDSLLEKGKVREARNLLKERLEAQVKK